MELLLSNPIVTIITAVVCVFVGKYLWVSKDDEKKVMEDINGIASKVETHLSFIKEDFSKQIHELEISMAERMGAHSEKMRVIQKETLDEANERFFSKEMADQHDERITALEKAINEITPRLAKIDAMFELMNKEK